MAETRSVPRASIGAFDALAKGDPAPRWLADAICARWSLPGDRTAITLITVSENATFLVSRDGAPREVVRVSRPGYVADPNQIAGELTWVHALGAEIDTPVPHPIAAADGTSVQTIEDEDGVSWFVVMFAFIPGTILEDDFSDPLPYYSTIGAITAEFHVQSRNWTPPAGFTRFSWELTDMVGPTARWGDWRAAALDPPELAVLERAEATALAALADLTKTPETWGIIHADLRPSNIMVHDGALTVIDFDDCGSAWYLYDFASAFSFVEHLPITPALAQAWVAGYTRVLPLSEDDLTHATALSMIRRLQMLGWTTTHREDALPSDIWAAQVPGTVTVAESYLANPRWLLET